MKGGFKFAIVFLILFPNQCVFAQSYPGGVSSNLYLWLKASAGVTQNGSSQLAAWADQSGNSMISQAVATASVNITYRANGINYNPVINFTGVSGYFLQGQYATAPSNPPLIFAVTTGQAGSNAEAGDPYSNSGAGAPGIFYVPSTGQYSIDGSGAVCSTSAALYNIPVLVRAFYNNTSNELLSYTSINAVANSVCSNSFALNPADGNFEIGGRAWSGFPARVYVGSIAEIIYLNANTATATQINQVESYLGLKYGISLGSNSAPVNYIASDGATKFWTASSTYQSDVFGIFRDNGTNGSGLLQSTSNSVNLGSGNGAGQTGKGNLILTSVSPLANLQSLMVGDDQGTLTEQTNNTPPGSPGAKRVNRTWLAQNTGNVGSVNLSFDMTGITLSGGNTVSNYALVVNTSGTSNFVTGNNVFYQANTISGSLINFNNVALPNNAILTMVTFGGNVLPLAWISFTATLQNNSALLKWTTSDETNADNYQVQQSYDDRTYTPVGSIGAKNGNGFNEYSYQLPGVQNGLSYYRIKRTDKDGGFSYSAVQTINNNGTVNVVIKSNPIPSGQMLTLLVSGAKPVIATLSISNMLGQLQQQQFVSVQGGYFIAQINISKLPAGTYFLRLQLGTQSNNTLKFLKL